VVDRVPSEAFLSHKQEFCCPRDILEIIHDVHIDLASIYLKGVLGSKRQ